MGLKRLVNCSISRQEIKKPQPGTDTPLVGQVFKIDHQPPVIFDETEEDMGTFHSVPTEINRHHIKFICGNTSFK